MGVPCSLENGTERGTEKDAVPKTKLRSITGMEHSENTKFSESSEQTEKRTAHAYTAASQLAKVNIVYT